jgi:hypothetical protein
MFAARMHDSGIAKTVGARTLGLGCGSMLETKPLTLPHSQLSIRIPNCVRLRADGTDEVAGIAPDFPVLPAANESPRARAPPPAVVDQDLRRAASGGRSAENQSNRSSAVKAHRVLSFATPGGSPASRSNRSDPLYAAQRDAGATSRQRSYSHPDTMPS